MAYSVAERECIGLCIAIEAINDIANHALLDVSMFNSSGEAGVRYKSGVHQDLFLIRLLDFTKEGGGEALTGVCGSCLSILLAACESRSFDSGGSVGSLEQATNALEGWLKTKTTFKMWLPTLELDVELTVPRIDFLYIIGNHAKHNLSRLTGISRHIAEILEQHGHHVELEQVPLALDDFREHLQEDYFVYYGTWLAELMNNVRWGTQEYLQDTFYKAYQPGQNLRYSYNYPDSIIHEAPRAWFWRLMNHVRTGPYIRRFVSSPYMKKEIIRA